MRNQKVGIKMKRVDVWTDEKANKFINQHLKDFEYLYKNVSRSDLFPFDAICVLACSEKRRLQCRRHGKGLIPDLTQIKKLRKNLEICFETVEVHMAIKKHLGVDKT